MIGTGQSQWKEVFVKRGWIGEDGAIYQPVNSRQATIQLGSMEYKISDVSGYDDDTIEFTKGSLVDTYLWSQITRVTVFKS
jgi:hypothetical protein